jgi:hypothetical protein
MPGYDGTGPAGAGPMTGRGLGYCILKNSAREDDSGIRGYMGLRGVPVGYPSGELQKNGKEAISMPRGDGTGPMGMGPMTGRAVGFCAGYPTPGFMNAYWGRAGVSVGPTGYPPPYWYGAGPLYGRGFPARRFGLGFGFGWGRGRGRGRGWFGRGW